MRSDIPQWMAQRGVTFSGGVGSTNEVVFCALGGLDKGSAPFTESGANHTITAGPTTTSPVIVTVNGVAWALPFNVQGNAPDYTWKALDSSVWTYS